MTTLLTFCLLTLAASPTEGQLAFAAGAHPLVRSVFIVDLATGAARDVGTGQGDGAPVWSPDGAWLAFTTTRDGGRGVRVVSAADGRAVDLPHAELWNDAPRWSADGRRLAYAAGTGLGQRIMVHDIELGTETEWGGGQPGLMRPVWLDPGGVAALLLLHQEHGEDLAPELVQSAVESGVLLAILAAPGERGLTTGIAGVVRDGWFPLPPFLLPSREGEYEEWAVEPDPTGRHFAFESNDGGDREIFTVSRVGAVNVSNHRAADWNPVWAPNGNWLAFESFRDGRRGVYRVFRDTIRVHRVAGGEGYEAWAPTWSPDGQWVAFTTTKEGMPRVAAAPAAGGEPVMLSPPGLEAYAPAWRPVSGMEAAE